MDFGSAMTISQKSIITDAPKTIGEDVQKKTSNKFMSLQGHNFDGIIVPIIFPMKRDLALSKGQQTVIGNGDAVSITTEIIENLFWFTERRFSINHPFLLTAGKYEFLEILWAG